MVSWLVAGLVIVINGYLLLEFFSSEVNGWLFGAVVSGFTVGYGAFIIYLIIHGVNLPNWLAFARTKRDINTGN